MRLGTLIAIVPLLLAACARGAGDLPPGGPGADEYAVWSAAVEERFGAFGSRFVVEERTVPLALDNPSGHRFLRERPGIPRALLADYVARNGSMARVSSGRLHPPHVRLLPDFGGLLGAAADLGSDGRLSLSRVGFDRGGTRALVMVSMRCGSLCAEGAMLVLERGPDGRWRSSAIVFAAYS